MSTETDLVPPTRHYISTSKLLVGCLHFYKLYGNYVVNVTIIYKNEALKT